MIQNQHDKRRKLGLLTQEEVCRMAKCSPGRLQYHTRRGRLDPPNARLHSRFFYTKKQAEEIAAYFGRRKRWQRVGEVANGEE